MDNDKPFGTAAYMLRRNQDPDTSHEAAELVDSTKLEEMVYKAVGSINWEIGAIQDDILMEFPGKPYSSITARFKGLLDKRFICYLGDKRKGRSGRNQRIARIERRKKARDSFELTPD